jgi:glycosyltransferase involved in cell wall biosynthesis
MRHRRDVHLLCLSGSLRSRLIEEFAIPAERCHNAGVPVDTEFFRAEAAAPHQPEPDEKPLIVSAGAAGRDYKTLIAAARQIDARFNIASGSSWSEDSTAATALPANIFMGSCGTYVKLRDLYARAEFIVVPLEEAFHASGYMVMAEAMAMGKPVIATRTQTPADLVIDGETGLLVPPGDVNAMTAAIHKLLANPEMRRAMGSNGRRLVEQHHSLPDFYSRLSLLAEQRIWSAGPTAQPAAGERAEAL